MSYDLTLAKDRDFSGYSSCSDLAALLSGLDQVRPNGDRGFVFEPGPRRRMEIDLETVGEEGDMVDEGARATGDEINCVRLHIPYRMMGRTPEQDFFPLIFTIAEHLGWKVYDDQTDRPVTRTMIEREIERQMQRPWWKFWE